MAEIDFQMALLLQHRFEQEYKASKDAQKSDQELARQLQEQFEQEHAVENPTSGLVYKDKPTKSDQNSSKSLVDPSWELVDPTPDIHNLFLVFNQRFFWNKLLAVCVSWSKRMTTCAGICSYNGRGGMCSITLSAPLLKLRPRKDLVETLLHEMIHAYLFVTHNNRDRDGHGPEFHKHMNRINKESGTNITVYHNFHDEVRLYQQHWWRCNGPCQHRKPFFGVVRRASNRAPGPNDRWWAEHTLTCGGTFIKVKEPEKNTKDAKKKDDKTMNNVKSKDIRDFMVPKKKSSDSSNIKGFKDLTSNVKGKYNSSSTIVVTKNSNTSDSTFKPTVFNAGTSVEDNVRSNAVDTNRNTDYSNDFLSVRDHWANKFNNSNKRPAPVEPSASTSKIQRTSETPSDAFCECPVCSKKVLMAELNGHLDICLSEPSTSAPKEETKECPVCNKNIKSSVFDVHVENCIKNIYSGVEDQLGIKEKEEDETVSCLSCGKKILKTELNSHLDDCMSGIFDEEFDNNQTDNNDEALKDDNEIKSFNCPLCMKLVEEKKMKEHLDGCL